MMLMMLLLNGIEMPLPPAMVNKKKQNDRTSTQEENTDLFIESLCVCVAEMQIE